MPKPKKSNTNQIRINAGVWRSRVIKFADGDGLRPTPDRVRQTLFNWLGQELTGKTCLDLFAGTGALGFEAASRNAKSVTMIELASSAIAALRQNLALLNGSDSKLNGFAIQDSKLNGFAIQDSKLNGFELPKNIQILQQDALQFLANNVENFDVIFCDPPYNKGWLDKLLPQLKQHLAPNGMAYVEAEFELTSSEDWQVKKSGKAGAVYYHLLSLVIPA